MPFIVTNIGGCVEIIVKSNNGVVVPQHSPQKLANEIARFVTDKALIEQLSVNYINNAHQYSIITAIY